jgi:membrane protein involved in colicin uptake
VERTFNQLGSFKGKRCLMRIGLSMTSMLRDSQESSRRQLLEIS